MPEAAVRLGCIEVVDRSGRRIVVCWVTSKDGRVLSVTAAPAEE